MAKSFRPFYPPEFQFDLEETVAWSEEHFCEAAADRYADLISQALRDLLEYPARAGAKFRPDLGANAFVYHLSHSRNRVVGERVKTPRHFVLYRYYGETIEFARLLHDSRDLAMHVPAAFKVE